MARVSWFAFFFVLAGCAPEPIVVGDYRIVTAGGGLLSGCQARTEFYYQDSTDTGAAPEYLGTCGTPRFITEHVGLPGDPSCFAVTEQGTSMVFFHRPDWCGVGDAAARLPGGVYLHTPSGGRQLLYEERQIGQIWSRAPLGPHSMRVSWHSAQPSRGGAQCGQRLVIHADGSEAPEGVPETIHGCADGNR